MPTYQVRAVRVELLDRTSRPRGSDGQTVTFRFSARSVAVLMVPISMYGRVSVIQLWLPLTPRGNIRLASW
jgi:hypothetical protein